MCIRDSSPSCADGFNWCVFWSKTPAGLVRIVVGTIGPFPYLHHPNVSTQPGEPGRHHGRTGSLAGARITHPPVARWTKESNGAKAHISTKANPAVAGTWIHEADEDQRWSRRAGETPPQGTSQVDGGRREEVHTEQVDVITAASPARGGEVHASARSPRPSFCVRTVSGSVP